MDFTRPTAEAKLFIKNCCQFISSTRGNTRNVQLTLRADTAMSNSDPTLATKWSFSQPADDPKAEGSNMACANDNSFGFHNYAFSIAQVYYTYFKKSSSLSKFWHFSPTFETLEWLLYLVSFHQKKYHPFYSKRSRNDIDGQKIYIYLKKINKTDLGVD